MEESNYNVIISKVDEHNFISIMQHFAEIFALDKEPAEQILKSAPIVFLQGLDKNTLRLLKGRLIFLSKMGVEFTIATRLSPTIPCVVWSGGTPNYTESSAGELIKFVDFQWNGNAFVCPNCSETFVFKRIGNPLVTSVKVTPIGASHIEAVQSGTNDISEGIDMDSEVLQVNESVNNIPEKEDATNRVDVVEIGSVPADDSSEEIIELQQIEEFPENIIEGHETLNNKIESTNLQEGNFLMENKPEEDIGVPEPILEPIPEPIEELIPEPIEEFIPELIEEPITEPSPPNLPHLKLRRNGRSVGRQVGQVAEPIVEYQKTMKASPPEKANCTVFITLIPPDKKIKASELIAKLKGVTIQQAQVLTTRSLVPVLKEVTKSTATNCLEEFKKIGVIGRITVKV